MLLKSLDKRERNFLSFSDKEISPIEKCKTIAETVVALITAIGFIPAGGYTVYEYYQQQDNRREDRTLELHAMQFEDTLIKIRTDLDGFYNPAQQEEEATEKVIKKRSSEIQDNPEQFKKFMILAGYYHGIVKCVKRNNCQEDMAKELFQKDIKTFMVNYGKLLCDLDIKNNKTTINNTLTSDLEEFVQPNNSLCNEDSSYGIQKPS